MRGAACFKFVVAGKRTIQYSSGAWSSTVECQR